MPSVHCYDNFLSSPSNKFVNASNSWYGKLDDGYFKFGQHTADLGQKVSVIYDDAKAAEVCGNMRDAFDGGRSIIGGTRVVFALYKLFTGQMFWQTDSDGWRRVKTEDNGQIVKISQSELHVNWVKQIDGTWRNQNTHEISADGVYIDDPRGVYLSRDFISVVLDVLVVTARTLSFINWINKLKAIDLGKHAQWMGHTIMGIWGVVISAGLITSLHNLANELDVVEMKRHIIEAITSFFDLIALPFDFGFGASIPPLAIAGAVLNILSAAGCIWRESIYFS